jgi:hypothetical protein
MTLGLSAFGCVARVDDQLGFANDLFIIVIGMIVTITMQSYRPSLSSSVRFSKSYLRPLPMKEKYGSW